jgi:hypothetical protein
VSFGARARGVVLVACLARLVRGVVAALSIIALSIIAPPFAAAQDGPAFGDSNWVSPYPVASEEFEPDGTGPRVAERSGEALGETVLRAPFRVVFFPMKAVARGLEWGAGLASPGTGTFNVFAIPVGNRLVMHPTGDISSSFGIMAGANFDVIDAKFPLPNRFGGTWSTRDARTANIAYYFGQRTDLHSMNVVGRYRLWPARSFYGIGNDARKEDRSIYLDEELNVEATYRFGRLPIRSLGLIVGYSDYSVREGYNDSPGVKDVFDPAEVPFLFRGSEVATIGVGGRWGQVDDVGDPALGYDLRFRTDRVHSTDDTDLDYQGTRLELRTYVPVLSKKRVLAFRMGYASALPQAGSAEVPFYRMPQSDGPYRFAGFEGRQFRDRHLAMIRAEYRWHILAPIRMTAFSELGEVASARERLRMSDVHEAYGMALRYDFTDTSIWRVELANSAQGWKLRIDLTKDF